MKKIINYTFGVLISVTLLSASVTEGNAQTNNRTIEKVYKQFSRAYEELDASLIKPLYADSCYYLVSNPEESIARGTEGFLKSLHRMFDAARKRDTTLKMTFKIVH